MSKDWIDPKKQFSKRLARWTAIFWFAFMSWDSLILFLAPETSIYTIYMAIIVSVVMIVNVYSYCKNSMLEKTLLCALDRTQLEISIGNNRITKQSSQTEPDDPEPDDPEPDTGESNG